MKRLLLSVLYLLMILSVNMLSAQEMRPDDMTSLQRARYLTGLAEGQTDAEEASGLYEMAIGEYQAALAEAEGPVDSIDIMMAVSNACAHVALNDKSRSYLQEAVDMAGSRFGQKSSELQICLLDASQICHVAGDYVQARDLLRMARNVDRDFFGNKRIEIKYVYRLAQSEAQCGRKATACRLLKGIEDKVLGYYGKDSQEYLDHVLYMSSCAPGFKSAANYRKISGLYAGKIIDEFGHLSEAGRERYWNSMSHYYDKILTLARLGLIPKEGYDAVLFSKGILLQTSVAFGDHVYASGDEKAISDYERMKGLMVAGASDHIIDSLDNEVIGRLDEIGKTYVAPSGRISWEDVRDALGDDDLAIEFSKTDDGYIALLLRHSWHKPKVFSLSVDEKYLTDRPDLKSYGWHDKRADWFLSRTIWKRSIRRHFPRTQYGRIYFSPDAQMCLSGVEYLPLRKPDFTKAGHVPTIADHYKIYRLSSTRRLVEESAAEDTLENAGLYGGMMFDFGRNRIALGVGMAENGITFMVDSLSENKIDKGYAVGPYDLPLLPGSIGEVHEIYDVLNREGFTPSIHTGMFASEDVFKMKASHNGLLHLATHGFYHTSQEALSGSFYRGLYSSNPKAASDPMYRSGISFAGANRAWRGGRPPQGFEDGILTAKEISLMDMRESDLVVLSACNTALGHVSKDGIYGLQRAFKKAGANSMILSLWRVDDNATRYMMRCFYINWQIYGMSKYDAFMAAQKQLRNFQGGLYSLPYYWKSFILLDPDIR